MGFAVGRAVGRGVGFAVGRGVWWAVGLGERVSVTAGVGVSRGDAVATWADGDAVWNGDGVALVAWVGRAVRGGGDGGDDDREPVAAGPQPATDRAATRAAVARGPWTRESRSIT